MKTFFLFSVSAACFFSPFLWRGAGGEASAQEKTDKQNMQVTTQDAFYPKGEQALYTYIMYKTKYPQEAIVNYVTGNVELSFDVMPDSSIKNVKIISDVGYGVGNAVKKMVEQLKFAPAIQMGMKVKMNLIMDFPVKAH
jgi:TonB family protein